MKKFDSMEELIDDLREIVISHACATPPYTVNLGLGYLEKVYNTLVVDQLSATLDEFQATVDNLIPPEEISNEESDIKTAIQDYGVLHEASKRLDDAASAVLMAFSGDGYRAVDEPEPPADEEIHASWADVEADPYIAKPNLTDTDQLTWPGYALRQDR